MQKGKGKLAFCKFSTWSPCKKQLSKSTESRSVDGQVYVEHNVQSEVVFCHESYSSVTDSPRAHVLECAVKFLQLNQGGVRCLETSYYNYSRGYTSKFLLS